MEKEDIINSKEFAEKFESKGFFVRIIDMIKGFKAPKFSKERKLADLELQRLQAPVISIVAIVLTFISLTIITAVNTDNTKVIDITIAEIEPDVDIQNDPEPETPPDPPEPDPTIDVSIDTPMPGPMTELTPLPTHINTPDTSVKPAKIEAVQMVQSPIKMKSILGGRETGTIGKATSGNNSNYGDPTTEATVLKVLWWLKATQATDGSWKGPNTLANTSLAVLTYLAHGEYPSSKSPYVKDFGPVVQLAIDYILNQIQDTNPVKMSGSDGNEYAFLIATYALSEAAGMTGNPNCKYAAEKCLERIINNQSPTGGWDYKLNSTSSRDDMSFAGWALQALKAGKLAGIHPEGIDECIKKAIKCLKSRNFKNGGFNYTAGGNPTGLTATGCLAMQLLGYGDQNEVASALDYMREWTPAFDIKDFASKSYGGSPQYYCYYATQCKYQAGMKQGAKKDDEISWQKWNAEMKKFYPSVITNIEQPVLDISGKPHKQGYFENKDAHSSRPVMDSCLVALQLMVYYRYLPTTSTVSNEQKTDVKHNDTSDVIVVVDL